MGWVILKRLWPGLLKDALSDHTFLQSVRGLGREGQHQSQFEARIQSGVRSMTVCARLQVEAIDLYQLHWPNPETDIEEGWSTLSDLKREGKFVILERQTSNVGQLQRAMEIDRVDSLQPPYSLIHPEVEDEILLSAKRTTLARSFTRR